MASKTESAQRPGARTDARTKGVGAEGTAAWKATLQGDDWSRLIIGALNTRYWRTGISIAPLQMGGMQQHKTCQGKVEMSPSRQSRNVPFSLGLGGVHVNLRVPVKRRRAMLASNPIKIGRAHV